MNTERVRPFSLRRYVLIMLLCYAGWVTLYYTTAWIGASRGPVFDPSLPIDATFPIVPWTFFIYLLAYVIVLGLFVIRRNAQFLNLAFSSFIVMNLGAFALFALFPAQGPERDFAAEGGGVIALVHLVDSRFNAFPSLHVANPRLVAFLSLKERGFSVPSMLFLLVAPAISLSTMLVRQHYLLDVLGGFALAVLTAAIVFPRKISSNPLVDADPGFSKRSNSMLYQNERALTTVTYAELRLRTLREFAHRLSRWDEGKGVR